MRVLSSSLIFLFFVIGYSINASEISFKTISVEDGLSNNFVKTIFKDTDGFIWVGTLEGLDRLDGNEIKSFSYKLPQGYESITEICEDNDLNLWIGTTSGLIVFNKKFETIEIFELDSINTEVNSLLFVKSSNHLFIGTDKGLYILDTRSGISEHVSPGLLQFSNNNNIIDIVQDSSQIWLATNHSLLSYSPFKQTIKSYIPNSATLVNIKSICILNNSLYVGTSNQGLIKFDLNTHTFDQSIDIGHNIVLSLETNKVDLLFIGTDGGGLKIYNPQKDTILSIIHNVNDPTSIISDAIYSFLYDNGAYWIGTFSGGLSYSLNKFRKFNIYSIDSKFYSNNKHIRSFYFSPTGDIYIGTRNGFYVKRKHESSYNLVSSMDDPDGYLQSDIILTIFPFNNKMIIGNYGGYACIYNPQTKKIEKFPNNFKLYSAYQIDQDHDGNYWIATLEGVYKFDNNLSSFQYFNDSNSGIKSNEVFSIKIDSEDRVWVGTMNGFSLIDKDNGKAVPFSNALKTNNTFKITYFYEDSNENVWVCSEKGGVWVISPDLKIIETFSTKNGLPDNSITGIQQDNLGQYWISTLRGFAKLTFQTRIIRTYNISDGLPGLVFNPAACYKTSDGILWWGNEKGLIYFNPDDIEENEIRTKVKFTGFYLDRQKLNIGENKSILNMSLNYTDQIYLPKKSNSIGFSFVALNFFFPADNNYSCKLEGFDTTWVNLGSQNNVFYDNLPSGEYTFMAKLSDDINNNRTASVKVYIKSSIWESKLFYVLLFVVLVLNGYFLRQYVLKQLRKLKESWSQSQFSNKEKDKYQHSKISDNRADKIIEKLRHFMENEKPFLNYDFNMRTLSAKTDISGHEISQVLNQFLNQNFADFVNHYRIEYFIELMEKEEYSKYTLTALSELCGFNSKSSFFRAFKRIKGSTPSKYIKDSKKQITANEGN